MTVICKKCGKEFLLNRGQIQQGCGKYCCKKCFTVGQNGEKNPNWKGGVSAINTGVWHSRQYNDWRTEVYERDNFTCQLCGETKSGNFNAHHIMLRLKYPLLTYDIGNGITLCKCCHKEVHKIYRKSKRIKKIMQNKLLEIVQ